MNGFNQRIFKLIQTLIRRLEQQNLDHLLDEEDEDLLDRAVE